jgi:hypothetical protein
MGHFVDYIEHKLNFTIKRDYINLITLNVQFVYRCKRKNKISLLHSLKSLKYYIIIEGQIKWVEALKYIDSSPL